MVLQELVCVNVYYPYEYNIVIMGFNEKINWLSRRIPTRTPYRWVGCFWHPLHRVWEVPTGGHITCGCWYWRNHVIKRSDIPAAPFLWMSVSTSRYHQHLTWVLFQHSAVTHRYKFQLWNPSWLYFPKLPYILQAYRHTCLQRNEAGERVLSRMVGIGKSVLFSTSTSKAFWMESNNCSMSLLVSTASLLLFSFGCFSALCY